jgi:S-formylglutathione hydrolase FrmB
MCPDRWGTNRSKENNVDQVNAAGQTLEPILHLRSYYSKALRRSQPYACYLPTLQAVEAGKLYPVLILLHGRGCDHSSWPRSTRIGTYLAKYGVVTIFPQGDDGWYTNSFDGIFRYEDDIIQDLAPEILHSTPAKPPGGAWAIGGMSMGGYGAIKIAAKYPELFSCAFSHGGAMNGPSIRGQHPIYGDPILNARFRIEQSLTWLVEQLLCRFPVQRPYLFLDCGRDDPLLEANRSFSDHLNFLGYHHYYFEASGQHTWPYWNRAFRTLLPSVAAHIDAKLL